MSYKVHLKYYDRHTDYKTETYYINWQDPNSLKTAADIVYRDKATADTIEELKIIIADLQDLRKALAVRYGELETMSFKMELRLIREHYSLIRYFVSLVKIYEDGTESDELREVYAGADRNKAIKRFEELAKAHPGISLKKDIAKSRWEK